MKPGKITMALEIARHRLERQRDGNVEPSGDDIVFATLRMAADIKRRDKNRLEGERMALAHELSMAADVYALFRHHLIGNARDRDWAVLVALAAGSNMRGVGAANSLSHVSIGKIKNQQCRNIWHNIACYMPGIDPIDMAMKLAESIAAESFENGE